MSTSHQKPMETLFDIAFHLDDLERQNFLDLVTRGDPDLGTELGAILAQCRSFDRLMEDTNWVRRLLLSEKRNEGIHNPQNVTPIRKEVPAGSSYRENLGQLLGPQDGLPQGTIGKYEILEKLGKGGQGTVLLVRQTQPDRKLALKLIHGSYLSDRMFVARFQREYQILSSMNHHHIARIYEVGKTGEGHLYFTMEYIAGYSITRYCRNKNLNLEARLLLFGQVCDGVQHAHRKLVLHRDLKPQNVLVTEVDGIPVVKIIDFGIAKPMQQSADEQGFQTQGDWVGTPAYMSPEQFAGSTPDIRGDIYALGMLLYELITDSKPFDPKSLQSMARDEVLRVYRLENPPKPSTRRRGRGVKIGDLDWVVMKAINKEPDLRYATVAELHEDCLNYLRNRPVMARPPEMSYIVGKFIHRYKALVVSATVVIGLLVAALVMTMLARSTSEEARRRYAKSFQTLESVLTAPHQWGVETRVIDLLQTADVDFDNEFEDDPQLEAAIRTVWGNTYFRMNLYGQARAHLEAGLVLLKEQMGARDPATLRAQYYLSRVLARQEDGEKARELLEQTYRQQKKRLGVVPDTMESLAALAYLLYEQGRGQQAADMFREAESLIHKMPPDATKAKCLNVLATIRRGKKDDAEDLYRQALTIQQKVLGSEHGNTLATMSNLANHLRRRGKFSESEAMYRDIIAVRQKKLGPEHDRTLLAQQGLAIGFLDTKRYREGAKIMRKVCRGFENNKAVARSLNALSVLGTILQKSGQLDEALVLYRDLIERYGQHYPNSPKAHAIRVNLADLLIGQGHFKEADTLLSEALTGMKAHFGEADPRTVAARMTLGQAHEGMGAHHEADRHYEEAVTLLSQHQPHTPELPYYRAIRAHNLTQLGRLEEAEKMLLESLERAQDPFRSPIRGLLVRHYRIRGDETRAKQYLQMDFPPKSEK